MIIIRLFFYTSLLAVFKLVVAQGKPLKLGAVFSEMSGAFVCRCVRVSVVLG